MIGGCSDLKSPVFAAGRRYRQSFWGGCKKVVTDCDFERYIG